ncbi:NAD(P)/FAD-dependent oxidoreductase [Sphingobium subterraneum]|uniref:Thioredoxin reductase n=1 Tax=Sphingobium subterraneum TaxID=627688 RepID=A0A841J497_9SPHN|nr:NAD(P)/FAD-dependent oxidoreductase [Sphingobium subterraneum]MBB6123348.1 thioredoxin reductase (NADPH) [Sphingobium subterraneum]
MNASAGDPWHCAIIGGGPAGLTAAIYLARFNLRTMVIDAGDSRAALIPLTRNHAGFPEGISGEALLQRMRDQAIKYGVQIVQARVEGVAKDGADFRVRYQQSELVAHSVLLAAGVHNHRPDMADDVHDDALRRGLLRYCPICDGYEVKDRRVAVLGSGEHGAKEALFLRSYTKDVTLICPDGPHACSDSDARVTQAGIVMVDGPCTGISIRDDSIQLDVGGRTLSFDALYPALGSKVRSDVIRALKPHMSEEGCMIVDAHQRTDIAGLYAAGDVVLGLDQISHAMGDGGVAATTIRNDLDERLTLWR